VKVDAVFSSSERELLGHSLDSSSQAALVASSSVSVQNVLTSHRIDDRLSLLEGFRSSSLIASDHQLANGLDSRAVLGTLCGEVLIARNSLTSALTSLFGVSHCLSLPYIKVTAVNLQQPLSKALSIEKRFSTKRKRLLISRPTGFVAFD
jgi:hypothetical protein